MKGFVPTPALIVDLMVQKLFAGLPPTRDSSLLDPGCGRGEFIEGVVRWCAKSSRPLPRILGIESDAAHLKTAASRFRGIEQVEIRPADFLSRTKESFDFIIGNPPYVSITDISVEERAEYRRSYRTAKRRFDLYMLFFEQALTVLKPGGRLVFITPEKFLYVESAIELRKLLGEVQVDELHFLDEEAFDGLITYPLVTTLVHAAPTRPTRVVHRNAISAAVDLRKIETSWLPPVWGNVRESDEHSLVLADICVRISCGVATGADSVFVVRDEKLEAGLRDFAWPTIAGRQILPDGTLKVVDSMLIPYSNRGQLLPERALGDLGRYLTETGRRARLLARTCVTRKPWYAFHENPPMVDVLRPKLLCKDICAKPFFVLDTPGKLVPRHSVYYVVPNEPRVLGALAEYLNSEAARGWLQNHCQRASNGFLRLQSHILKRLPLPASFKGFIPHADAERNQLAIQLA